MRQRVIPAGYGREEMLRQMELRIADPVQRKDAKAQSRKGPGRGVRLLPTFRLCVKSCL